MRIEFKCPKCRKNFEANMSVETELSCPFCDKKLHVPQAVINSAEAESLMDPADPTGAMNYFPEDE